MQVHRNTSLVYCTRLYRVTASTRARSQVLVVGYTLYMYSNAFVWIAKTLGTVMMFSVTGVVLQLQLQVQLMEVKLLLLL
jgi:hypothetical protein